MNLTLEQLKKEMERNGGSLYLRGTNITALPEGLTVGGSLDLEGCTNITNQTACKTLKNGDFVEGKYIYCDGVLTHIKHKKRMGEYTFFVGKIKGVNVICDGEHYAHCESFSDGVCDLEFKKAKDRGAEQYKSYTLDTVVSFEEAKVMYRVITGACKVGTENFVKNQREIKNKYMVREIIDITEGQYRSEVFKRFFAKKGECG